MVTAIFTTADQIDNLANSFMQVRGNVILSINSLFINLLPEIIWEQVLIKAYALRRIFYVYLPCPFTGKYADFPRGHL